MPRKAFKALQKRNIHSPRAELVDELVIVDSQLLPITRDGTLYIPGCYDLLMRRRRVSRLDRAGRCRSGNPARLEPRSGNEV